VYVNTRTVASLLTAAFAIQAAGDLDEVDRFVRPLRNFGWWPSRAVLQARAAAAKEPLTMPIPVVR
jgi:hypothetical protein